MTLLVAFTQIKHTTATPLQPDTTKYNQIMTLLYAKKIMIVT